MRRNMKHLLCMALVMIMVFAAVPAMAFATETNVALNAATNTQYTELSAALDQAEAGQIVRVLADVQESIVLNEDVILDLNGNSLTNVTVPAGVTVTVIDSATDDYQGSYGSLSGNIEGKIAASAKITDPKTGAIKSYVTACEESSYSFHRYYAAITKISLKPSQTALGYKAEFYGDETVQNAVVSYGYELWVNDNAHKTYTRTDALESNVLTLRLKNILKEGDDAHNAIGVAASIGSKAVITLNLNGQKLTLSSTEQQATLRQAVEAVNRVAGSYSEAQLEAVRAMCTTYAQWMEGWATENIFGIGDSEGNVPEGGLDVEITVDVTSENNVVTENATLSNETVSAQVPQGVLLDDNTTQLVLTITEKATSDSGVELEEGQSMLPLDVHIQGVSAENTAPITVCLGDILPKGLNIGNYTLYHVENGEAVEMTRVYSLAELDAHNEFYYDPATGAVTVSVASFSEFALRTADANVWQGNTDTSWYTPAKKNTTGTTYKIYNADQLQGLSDLVANGTSFKDETVILMSDITFAGETEDESLIFYPVGYYAEWNSEGTLITNSNFKSFQGIFDGNGHTVSNLYQQTWAMKGDYRSGYPANVNYYKDGMGLFGYVVDGTVKNLTMEKFVSVGEFAPTGCITAYAKGECTFENISLRNCHPATYNTGVAGIVGWDDGGDDTSDDEKTHYIYKNITIDSTNEIEALWGSWDVAAAGLQGYLAPYSTAYLENCHLAPTINVYNDVCGNYQYYWYRYCGMFIGTVDKTDANGVLDLSNITATNCTADFGDRHEYYYCEFVKNSIASYTHDYQFSRVDNADITVTNGISSCNHDHDARGEEEINGEKVLIEDKQAVYIPFRQLFGGYGWGVDGVDTYENIQITTLNASAPKFESILKDTTVLTDSTLTIGQLFKAVDGITLDKDNVQVFISPVGETSTASGTYVANTDDWTQGTLTFSGKGAAEIIITDYYFCVETRLEIYVDGYTVRYNDPTGITTVIYGEDGIDKLPTCEDYEGKTFFGWALAPVDDKSTEVNVITEGYIPTDHDIFLYAIYTYAETSAGSTTYEKYSGALTEGDYLIVYSGGAMKAGISSNRLTYTEVTVSGNEINSVVTDDMIWHIAPSGNYWTICSKDTNTYAAATGADNKAQLLTSGTDDKSLWTASGTSTYEFVNKYNTVNDKNANLRRNSTYGFATYSTSTGGALTLYKVIATAGELTNFYVTICADCEHTNKVTDSKAATCTAVGYTTVICTDCGVEISHEDLSLIDHIYENGSCTMCGKEQSDYSQVTDLKDVTSGDYVIAAKVNGTYYAMGTTLNDKSKIAPVVIEVDSEGRVDSEGAPIWKIVSTQNGVALYNGTSYLKSAGDNTNLSVADTSFDWKIAESDNTGTFTIQSSSVTNRGILYSVENSANVFGHYANSNNGNGKYYGDLYLFKAGSVVGCAHENVTTVTTDATCTAEGSIVTTCTGCGHVESETIAKLPHNFVDGVCSACGEDQVIIPEIPETGMYQLVTDINEITVGGKFVIVAEVNGVSYALGHDNSTTSGKIVAVKIDTDNISEETPTWLIGQYGESLALNTGATYLRHSSGSNTNLTTLSDPFAWTVITVEDTTDEFRIVSSHANTRGIVYRNTGIFGGYAFSNHDDEAYCADLKLYKLVEGGIEECAHPNQTTTTVDATCTEAGSITVTCDDCSETVSTETIAALGHDEAYTSEGECGRCHTENPDYEDPSTNEPTTLAIFTFGENNGKENTTSQNTYSETDGNYTLNITNGSNMYVPSFDTNGNSCLKIGSSSKKGSFEFTVKENVTKVVIYVAKYNNDNSKVTINSTQHTLTAEYQAIEVDTSTNKTVTISAVNTSSCRAIINTIEFWGIEN